LTIEASGIVKEDITDGAYVKIQVKYGYIKLLDTRADLCEEVKNVDLECPIEKGKIAITKEVELPKEIPPVRRPAATLRSDPVANKLPLQGKYTVQADVFTKDDDHITCLTATVFFGRKSVPFLDL
jgi:hypothetical protein